MGESGKSFRESWAQRLTDSDTVSESDILNLFQSSSPEIAAEASRGFLAAREDSDKRLVLESHHERCTASNLMIAAKRRRESRMRVCRITPTSLTPRLPNRKSPER